MTTFFLNVELYGLTAHKVVVLLLSSHFVVLLR
jgi:hypothetical protein